MFTNVFAVTFSTQDRAVTYLSCYPRFQESSHYISCKRDLSVDPSLWTKANIGIPLISHRQDLRPIGAE